MAACTSLGLVSLGFATALLLAAQGAGAASSQANGDNGDTSPGAKLPLPDAYMQGDTTDPYNQTGFGDDQSFGLAMQQMLGAAAACEEYRSQRMTLGGQQRAKARAAAGAAGRADIDAAQDHMLNPIAAGPGGMKTAQADCDHLKGGFPSLLQIQLHDQELGKKLDQPDAMAPRNPKPQR